MSDVSEPETGDPRLRSHLLRQLWAPVVTLVVSVAAQAGVGLLDGKQLTEEALGILHHGLAILTIVASGWFLARILRAIQLVVRDRFPLDVDDNLHARQVRTQMQLLRRVGLVIISIVVLAMVLMTFPKVREVGAGLLASAGIAGLVAGVAARPVLANLIAGVQVALTQPIRIDDVVIVEGEWGRIESIGTTYVVVCIWDQRRLVVPLSQFIEKPFENWTRETTELLGTVYLYADYNAPIDEMRAALKDIAANSGLWDGRVCSLLVTDSGERSLQIRALVSAADSGKAWDLRCHVREKLITWLQRKHPECLPRFHAEVTGSPAPVS